MKEKKKFIIGKKVGMTQIFNEEGNLLQVTVIQAGPCVVVQKKVPDIDGYSALQLGFEGVPPKHINKAQVGHLQKHNINQKIKVFKEFRVESDNTYNEGDKLSADIFIENDIVKVTGKSIGKGFQGTVKRWHFNVGPWAHGSKNHRIPGSIGAGSGQSRVLKGKKMYGHMGAKKVTVSGLKVVRVVPEQNLIMVLGSVPGKKNTLVTVSV